MGNNKISLLLRLIVVVSLVLATFSFIVQPAAAAPITHDRYPSLPGYLLNLGTDVEQFTWSFEFNTTPLWVRHTIEGPYPSTTIVDFDGTDISTGYFSPMYNFEDLYRGQVAAAPAPTTTSFTGTNLSSNFPVSTSGLHLIIDGVDVGAFSVTGNVFTISMGVAPVAGQYFNFGGAHQTLPGVAGDEAFHHKWTVPAGLAPGVYTSRVRYYSSASNHGPLPISDFEANWDSEGSQRFTVKQPLAVYKYDDLDGSGSQGTGEDGLDGWLFNVTGPASAGWPFSGNVLGTPPPTNQDFTGNGLSPNFPLAGNNLYVNGVNVGAYTLSGDIFHLTVAAGFTPVAGQRIVNNEFSGITTGGGNLTLPDIDTIGDYTITETLQSHWRNTQPGTLTRVVHIPGDIGIGPGLIDPSDPTIPFGNQELGSLEIIKNTTGGNGTFTYAISGGPTTVTDKNITTSGGTGSVTVHDLLPGDYTVTENNLPAGWEVVGNTQEIITVPTGGTGTATFTNTAYGNLKITKNTHSGNGTFTYTVTGGPSSGIAQQSVTTSDGTGFTMVNHLIAGTYTVTEINLPPGWTADSGIVVRTVVVPINDTGEGIFDNTARGDLKIVKNTVGGNGTFTFTTTGPDSVPLQTIVTLNNHGEALVTGLKAGDYTVTEGSLLPGWTSNDPHMFQTVAVPINDTGTVTFSNTAKGSLKIIKNTRGGNATFTFTGTGPETVSQQSITTSGGTGFVMVENLIAGEYTIFEGSLDSGWTADGGVTQHTVIVPINGTGEVTFANTARGNLKIVKNTIGADGTFAYTVTSAGLSPVDPQTVVTTANHGEVQVDGLIAGQYTVIEGQLPDGWTSNTLTTQIVTVPIGSTGTATFENVARGSLKIEKFTTGGNGTFGYSVSSNGLTPVSHQSFATTAGYGSVTISGLIAGDYQVVEDVIPPGWTPVGGTDRTVTVPLNSIGTATFNNTGKGSLQIIKTTTGGDASFTYTVTSNGLTPVGLQTIATSSHTGQVTIPDLVAGDYTVTEGALPGGWTADGGVTQHIVTVPIDGTGVAEFANTARGNLKIIKHTRGGDAAFTFTVSGISQNIPNQTVTTSGGTNFVIVSGLIAGDYTITEINLPAGWLADGAVLQQTVTVPIDGTGEVTFNNTAYGSLEIIKNTTGGDGTFGYSVTSSGLTPVVPQTITTVSGQGSVIVHNLIAGNYDVTEDVIPPGWTPDGNTLKSALVPINGIGTVTFSNTGKGNLKITKNTTGGDASFTYTVTSSGLTPVSPQTFATSSGTGSVTVAGLISGTYTVTETTIPLGWEANGGVTQHSVFVPINDTGEVTFANTAFGSLKIVKNTVGGNGTFGYTVTSNGLTPVAHQSITTASGTGSVQVDHLIAGNYTVVEDNLPPGWSAEGNTTVQVTVPVNSIGTATFNNTGKGNLQIVKHTTGGNGTFAYTVTSSGLTPVDPQSVITAGGVGSVTVTGLIAGKYTVIEGQLPNGWIANGPTSVEVDVPIDGTGVANFSNTALGNLKIIKNTTGGDASFTYSVTGGPTSPVANQTVSTASGTGSTTVTGLIAGDYTVNEINLATGWTANGGVITQTVTVPINGTGEVTFANTAHGSLKIVKHTTGGNGTFSFTTTGGPSTVNPQTINTAVSNNVQIDNLVAGSYTVNEGQLPAGWITDLGTQTSVTVTVPINGIGTADFYNTAQGSLKIIKHTTGGDGTFSFNASGPSTVLPQNINTATVNFVQIDQLTAGSYTVNEGNLPAGWESDLGTFKTVTVQVPINGIGTADFYNTAYGNLEINKTTTGGNATFIYGVTGGLSTVADQSITTVSNTGTKMVTHLIAGGYTVTEKTLPPGWSNDTPMVRTVTVPVNGTGTVAYANTGRGTLRIIKNTNGGDSTFDFTATGAGPVPGQSITTSGGTGQVDVTVIAGHYTVNEGVLPTDWVPSSDTTQEVDVPVNGVGTVTFTNTGRGKILIIKYHDKNKNGQRDAGEEGLAGWNFTVSGLPGTYPTDQIGRAFVDVDAGSYTVTEVNIDPTWSNTDPGGATPHKHVTVSTSGTIEVDFGNFHPGELIIEKRDEKSGHIIDAPGVTFSIDPDPFTGTGELQVEDNDPLYDSNPDNGIIDLKGILMGTYIVTEIVAPAGYTVDSNPMPAIVNLTKPVVTVVSEDKPIRVPASSNVGIAFMIAGMAGLMVIFIRRKARQS